MSTLQILILLFILCFGLAMAMCSPADALILDHILDGVKEIVGHEIQKIEAKIDEFVMAEVAKVKHEMVKAWVIQTVTLLVYSTVLIFLVFYFARRHLK